MQLTTQGPEMRYAKALFQLSVEHKTSYVEAATALSHALRENEELMEIMATPVVSTSQKFATLTQLVSSYKVDKTFSDFLSVICEKRRTEYLMGMMDWYIHFHHNKENVVEAQVVSATKLSDNQRSEIEKFILSKKKGAKSVFLEEDIDTDLIAGFKVIIGSDQYDSSVRGRLDGLRADIKSFN